VGPAPGGVVGALTLAEARQGVMGMWRRESGASEGVLGGEPVRAFCAEWLSMWDQGPCVWFASEEGGSGVVGLDLEKEA